MRYNWEGPASIPGFGQTFQAGFQQGRQHSALSRFRQDPQGAINALMPVDPQTALHLQGRVDQQSQAAQQAQQAKQERDTKVIAQLAQNARDPETWDAAVDQAVAMGYPDAAQLRGKFNPAVRAAVMAAGGLKDEATSPDLVVIDGVAIDKRTGQPVFESPYPRIVNGPGGIYEQPRIGFGRGGTGPAPQGRAVTEGLPPGWTIVDEDEGGAGPGDPRTFP